jgi:Icc-related predicted phosphoesterase
MVLKILITSDFHEKEELKEAAIEEANSGEYDLFINLGDYMSEEYAERLFDGIEDAAAVGTTGNRDMMFSEEFMNGDTPVYNFLEADIDEKYKLILIGGDFPDDIKHQVDELMEETDSDKVIVGSHYPPHKLGDRIRSGRRIGFEQFRELIMKYKPALWASGHVHEDFGEYSLFDTKVLNAAGEETGKAFSVTIGDEGGVEEVEELTLVE